MKPMKDRREVRVMRAQLFIVDVDRHKRIDRYIDYFGARGEVARSVLASTLRRHSTSMTAHRHAS